MFHVTQFVFLQNRLFLLFKNNVRSKIHRDLFFLVYFYIFPLFPSQIVIQSSMCHHI